MPAALRTDLRSALHPAAGHAARGLISRVLTALAIRRQRARLVSLDDHILHDIGLTRDQAHDEARRRFWDVPGHWRG